MLYSLDKFVGITEHLRKLSSIKEPDYFNDGLRGF